MTKLLTPGEVSEWLGISTQTLSNYRSAGGGPPYCKLFGRVRYLKDDLDIWIEERTTHVATGTERKMALPVLGRRPGKQRKHRLGGHRKKSGQGGAEGSETQGSDSNGGSGERESHLATVQ